MHVFYTDHFVIPLPEGHRFPIHKYRLLRERIETDTEGLFELTEPRAASDDEIRLAHASEYLEKVMSGRFTRAEIRRLGFPWSAQLVERSRRSVGATIEACAAALRDGAAASLAGGTHHASRDRGAGFCVFNDTAVAARVLTEHLGIRRVLIVDCDVHQGDGTAAILAEHSDIYTFSIHAARNYPLRKIPGDLDIALPDDTGDAEYLDKLGLGLEVAFERSRPEVVLYLAGADPYAGDRLGRLSLSKAGLAGRDDAVCEYCRRQGANVAVVMGGGYPASIEDAVDIHYYSVSAAARLTDPEGTPRARTSGLRQYRRA